MYNTIFVYILRVPVSMKGSKGHQKSREQRKQTCFKELAHICVLCSAIASPSLLAPSPIRVNPNSTLWVCKPHSPCKDSHWAVSQNHDWAVKGGKSKGGKLKGGGGDKNGGGSKVSGSSVFLIIIVSMMYGVLYKSCISNLWRRKLSCACKPFCP